MYWIVAYDVHATRRRNRVARRLERAGLRIRKSVSLVQSPEEELRKLVDQLGSLINPETDQVAAWPLRKGTDASHPTAGFPEGPQYQELVIW